MALVGAAEPVWRVAPGIRRLAVGVGLFFVLVALGLTAIGLSPGSAAVMWAIALLILASVWRCYLVPYVALTPQRLVVCGAFARRTVAYGAINGARPGLYGLRIETTDQGAFVAWAVQKSKFSEWTHRHTRADDVAEAIMGRVHDAARDGAHA